MVTAFSWLGIQLSLLQKGFILFGEALSPGKFGKNNGKKRRKCFLEKLSFLNAVLA